MKRWQIILFIILIISTTCTACNKLEVRDIDGTYIAVNYPETEEMVVESIVINKDRLTMISGSKSQRVGYVLDDDQITIYTIVGNFTYSFYFDGQDTIILDDITYIRKLK